jgi:hypothetical protein
MVQSYDFLNRQLRRRAEAAFNRASVQYGLGKLAKCNHHLQVYWDYLYMISVNEKTAPPAFLQEPAYYFGQDKSRENHIPEALNKTLNHFPKISMKDALGNSTTEKLDYMAACWFTWAAMLFRAGRIDDCKKALNRRWNCLYAMSVTENTIQPEAMKDPADYFGNSEPGDFPDQLARVPKVPFPVKGSGAISLQLPEKTETQ